MLISVPHINTQARSKQSCHEIENIIHGGMLGNPIKDIMHILVIVKASQQENAKILQIIEDRIQKSEKKQMQCHNGKRILANKPQP